MDSHMTDRILDLTLEIVYLLTGEKCAVVKMVSIEGLLQGMYPLMSGEWSRTQSPTMESPPTSLTYEKTNEKKILEVTKKMMELLTGEARLEECSSIWKMASMENQLTLPSSDSSARSEETQTSRPVKEEGEPCEGQTLFEGDVPLEVDYTTVNVKEEDLQDGDCWTPVPSPSAQREDVSERRPLTSYLKEETDLTASPSSASLEKSLSEDPVMRLVSAPSPPPRQSPSQVFLLPQPHFPGPPSHFCSECGKSFIRREQLVRHRRIHTGPKRYACPECNKTFRMKSQLVVHRRVHTGEKPFACADCGRSFARQQILDSHKVIHSGERPFACSECAMTFSRTSHLIIHRRIHSGEKPYSCSECERPFRTRSALIAHQRTHTGERPYQCSVCGKRYTHSSHLVVHQRSHSGEKPYSCLECGKRFAHKSGLVRHQHIHTRKRP